MKTVLKNETKVIIANARLSYANLFEPKAFEGQKPKYSVSLIIPKSDTHTIGLIEQAIANALAQGKEKFWSGKEPKGLKLPLRDGDEDRDDEAYQDSYFINANSVQAPQVVGKERDRATGKPIPLGEDDVYSGCYANVSINFYPFNTNGSKGIAAGLNNVQKEADGEAFAGKAPASDDFDFEDVDSDDDFLN